VQKCEFLAHFRNSPGRRTASSRPPQITAST
jgi:hypothetical protein